MYCTHGIQNWHDDTRNQYFIWLSDREDGKIDSIALSCKYLCQPVLTSCNKCTRNRDDTNLHVQKVLFGGTNDGQTEWLVAT